MESFHQRTSCSPRCVRRGSKAVLRPGGISGWRRSGASCDAVTLCGPSTFRDVVADCDRTLPRIVSRLRCGRESNLASGRFRRWRKKRQKFLVNIAKCGVMFEQHRIDFRKPLQNRTIRGELLALLDERTNDINAHGDSAIAPQDVCSLQRPVFGECPRAIFPITTTPEL